MKTLLPELIAEIGDESFAAQLDVPLRTVESWRRRERYPRPRQAQVMIDRWPDRLSYDFIYGGGSAANDDAPPAKGNGAGGEGC